MKKLWLSLLCVLLAVMMVACGKGQKPDDGDGSGSGNGGDPSSDEAALTEQYGAKVSNEEAEELLAEIEAWFSDEEALKALSWDKFTYHTTTTIGENAVTSSTYYSKNDGYYREVNEGHNIKEYLYDTETEQYTDTLFSNILSTYSVHYYYLDISDCMISASSCQSVKEIYYPENDRQTENSATYSVVEQAQAQERFDENTNHVQLFSGTLQQYANQILMSVKPMLEMGDFGYQMDGVDIQIRSKGEGHLYIAYKMDLYGMKTDMAMVIENGYVTYFRSSVPNTDPGWNTGLVQEGDIVTMEMRLEPNKCELVYPDLSGFERVG